ncbi:MAG: hypothetical protein SGBAC_002946 [Bacillariaceae sp.]
MTIKGPNAHNYRGGLDDLLGWGEKYSYDYEDDYDAEAHRRYLYEQQIRKHQQQQQYQPEPESGFSNALSSPPPQRYSVANDTEIEMGDTADAEAEEAARKAKLEK